MIFVPIGFTTRLHFVQNDWRNINAKAGVKIVNGAAMAAVLTTAAFAFVIWFAWLGTYEPSPAKLWSSFAAWFLPLFYAGGWAAGWSIGETTGTLLLLIFFSFLAWVRQNAPFWGADLGQSMRDVWLERRAKANATKAQARKDSDETGRELYMGAGDREHD